MAFREDSGAYQTFVLTTLNSYLSERERDDVRRLHTQINKIPDDTAAENIFNAIGEVEAKLGASDHRRRAMLGSLRLLAFPKCNTLGFLSMSVDMDDKVMKDEHLYEQFFIRANINIMNKDKGDICRQIKDFPLDSSSGGGSMLITMFANWWTYGRRVLEEVANITKEKITELRAEQQEQEVLRP